MPKKLEDQIAEATKKLATAEKALQTAMSALESGARADKKMITDVLQTAFRNVADAKSQLAETISRG